MQVNVSDVSAGNGSSGHCISVVERYSIYCLLIWILSSFLLFHLALSFPNNLVRVCAPTVLYENFPFIRPYINSRGII